jgi:hypothetical protein
MFYICEDAYTILNDPPNPETLAAILTGNGASASLQFMGSLNPTEATDLTGSLTGFGLASTEPYDVRANFDTSKSRRYWWPLLRCDDWIQNDGVAAYTSAATLNSVWPGGVGSGNPTSIYGRLRLGMTDYFGNISSGFSGQPLYADGTPAATELGLASNVRYGVDFGYPVNHALYYGIHRKITPCAFVCMVASTAGVVQLKTVPFNLSI